MLLFLGVLFPWASSFVEADGMSDIMVEQAEKAAWALAEELKMDLVTVLPSLVLGPVNLPPSNHSLPLKAFASRCEGAVPACPTQHISSQLS